MKNLLKLIPLAYSIFIFSLLASAQEIKFVRTIPVIGLQFDIDWTNRDIFSSSGLSVARYDLATGGLETAWTVPAGSLINDVAARAGGVFIAAAGNRRLYFYNSEGGGFLQTDLNTQNRIGDVRGMLAAGTGAYLVGNPGTILRIGYNPFGSLQVVGGWGVFSNNISSGYETCVVGEPPFCYSSGYSGAELGKVTGAIDLSIRENVENTGNFALFVLERRPVSGGTDNRVSIFSDEGMPGLFAPQTFLFGGNVASNDGSGAFQFSNPSGIAVDAERGRVFIADQGNNRLVAIPYGSGVEYKAYGWGVDTGADVLETCTIASGCQKGLVSGLNNPLRVQVDPVTGDVYVSHLGGIAHFTFGALPGVLTPTATATIGETNTVIPGGPQNVPTATVAPEAPSHIPTPDELKSGAKAVKKIKGKSTDSESDKALIIALSKNLKFAATDSRFSKTEKKKLSKSASLLDKLLATASESVGTTNKGKAKNLQAKLASNKDDLKGLLNAIKKIIA